LIHHNVEENRKEFAGTLALKHYDRLMASKDQSVYTAILADCIDVVRTKKDETYIFKDHTVIVTHNSKRFPGKTDILIGRATRKEAS
jgi:hypothetical protein